MEQEYITIDLREILSLLKKNLIFLIISTLLGALAALLISLFLLNPKYEAAATLVVNTWDEQATVVTYDQINSAKQLVSTYAVLLTNDSLLSEIIKDQGLDDTLETLKDRISAEAVDQTQVMRITVQDEDPQVAQAILQTIVDSAPDILINTVKAGSVEIVSPPRVEPKPVFPRPLLNIAVGAVAGLVICLAVVFIRKALSNTFVTDDDINRYLDLPVLGVIPSIKLEEIKHVR